MAGSLQDQLLKAGLVSDQQVRDSRRKKHKKRKQASAKGKQTGEDISLAKAYGQRAQTEKAERDRELNLKREEARRRKEIKAQLRQLILPNALNDKAAEIQRHFEFKGKIRKIYLTEDQQKGLNSGRLGIAYFGGRYYLLESERISKVAAVDEAAVALLVSSDSSNDEPIDEHYSQFQVPDDLMW
jgi:uncharacterized protein YaiL (DUF2058 family)